MAGSSKGSVEVTLAHLATPRLLPGYVAPLKRLRREAEDQACPQLHMPSCPQLP